MKAANLTVHLTMMTLKMKTLMSYLIEVQLSLRAQRLRYQSRVTFWGADYVLRKIQLVVTCFQPIGGGKRHTLFWMMCIEFSTKLKLIPPCLC